MRVDHSFDRNVAIRDQYTKRNQILGHIQVRKNMHLKTYILHILFFNI